MESAPTPIPAAAACLPLEGGGFRRRRKTEGVVNNTGGHGDPPLHHYSTLHRIRRGGVSLRLGPPAALTVRRTVIHFRGMSLRYSVPSRKEDANGRIWNREFCGRAAKSRRTSPQANVLAPTPSPRVADYLLPIYGSGRFPVARRIYIWYNILSGHTPTKN